MFPFLVDSKLDVNLFESEDICAHLLANYGDNVNSLPSPSGYFYPSTIVTGWAPAIFRLGRGAEVEPRVASRPTPGELLRLYSYEGNQFCRLVREALCELDLPYELRSTGKGSARRAELCDVRGDGKTTAPFLVDPNTNVSMGESADIVRYLWSTYG